MVSTRRRRSVIAPESAPTELINSTSSPTRLGKLNGLGPSKLRPHLPTVPLCANGHYMIVLQLPS